MLGPTRTTLAPAPPGRIVDGRLGGNAVETDLRRLRSPRVLKTAGQIRQMQAAGRLVCCALKAARSACVPGATTAEVDEAAARVIGAAGGESVLRGYPGRGGADPFPADTCVSVNEQVVHGVPGPRRLRVGDIVTIDCGVSLNGWCADAAIAVEIGPVDAERRRLVETAELALATAILMIRPDRWWSEIALTIQAVAREAGYGIVPGFVGHGIGRRLHEPPQVPSLVTPEFLRHHDFRLRPGMTLAIEPILAHGTLRTRTLADGWTVVTTDGGPACHVEHTVAVTASGATILTSGRQAVRS